MNSREWLLLAFAALAVLLVVKIIGWRELLALCQPHSHFTGAEAPATGKIIAPLFDEREEELQALGFSLLQRSQLAFTPAMKINYDEARLYRSGDGKTLALVEICQNFYGAGLAPVRFFSRASDGTLLQTGQRSRDDFLINLGEGRSVDGYDCDELYTAHRELIKDRALQSWPEAGETTAILNGAMAAQMQENLRRGLLWQRPDGALALTLRGAWAYRRCRNNRASRKLQMPLPRVVLFHWTHLQQRRRYFHLSRTAEWGFFTLTALLFLLLGALYFDLRFSLLLFLVILIHEGGHWLTMRLLGHRQVHMIFLPLIGGLAIGEEERASPSHRAWIYLMGPLPGIVLALALAAAYIYLPGFDAFSEGLGLGAQDLQAFIDISLFVNGLNLLPIMPLDGGQLLRTLLPRRALTWALAFCLLSMVLIVALVLKSGWGYELMPLLLLSLTFSAGQLWRQRRQLRRWQREEKKERAAENPEMAQLRRQLDKPIWDFARALALIQMERPGGEISPATAAAALELVKIIREPAMGWGARLFFFTLWLGGLAAIYFFRMAMGL